MIFRRPELEKDNPIAPEPYVGPRRRLAMARAAALKSSTEGGDLRATLHTLTNAAARFMKALPKSRKISKNLQGLQDAIGQARRVLAAEESVGKSRESF